MSASLSIVLPEKFGAGSMYFVIEQATRGMSASGAQRVEINFARLKFIEPIGVVILSNLIEYLRRTGVPTVLTGINFQSTPAVAYLDDCDFFRRYTGASLRTWAKPRDTCLPLTMVANATAVGFLHAKLIPWLAMSLNTSEESLATVRICLDEVFSNINFHSGVDNGCLHIQHFPNSKEVQIAISDFGVGIPANVRKIRPEVIDSVALSLACEEGFTTQSNVKNRGAGLATLIRYLTLKDRGKLWIVSGTANLSAIHDSESKKSKVTSRSVKGFYPGTLVRITLKQDSIQDLATDVQSEEFSW
jgi:anti-sigma regulatory factor (Ser/Thr protein kinase)